MRLNVKTRMFRFVMPMPTLVSPESFSPVTHQNLYIIYIYIYIVFSVFYLSFERG